MTTPAIEGVGQPLVAARHAMYRILGTLLLPPTEERLATIVTALPTLTNITQPLDGTAGHRAWTDLLRSLESLDDSDLEVMASEYTSLFLSGSRDLTVQPFESSHVEVSEYDIATVSAAVESSYRQANVALVSSGQLPDHLAVELEFCAYLCHCEGDAEDDVAAARWRDDRRTFLHAHLLRWLPAFIAELRRVMPESLYATVAETALSVAEDDRLLIEAIAQLARVEA